MAREGPPVVRDKYSSFASTQFENLVVWKTMKSKLVGGLEIDFTLKAAGSEHYSLIKIIIRLKPNLHSLRTSALRRMESIRRALGYSWRTCSLKAAYSFSDS